MAKDSFDAFLFVCATVCETILIILAIQKLGEELIKEIKEQLKNK